MNILLHRFTCYLGRIAQQQPKSGPSPNNTAQLRLNRRNQAKQTQIAKRNALVSASRIFSGVDGAPRIVVIIPLTEDVSAQVALSSLVQALDMSSDDYPKEGLHKIKCASSLCVVIIS